MLSMDISPKLSHMKQNAFKNIGKCKIIFLGEMNDDDPWEKTAIVTKVVIFVNPQSAVVKNHLAQLLGW